MPGPHDFAVRSDLIVTPSTGMCAAGQRSGEGIEAPFVLRVIDRSQASLPCDLLARRRCRIHRIPPHVNDDRDTPLGWGGTGEYKEVIWGRGQG